MSSNKPDALEMHQLISKQNNKESKSLRCKLILIFVTVSLFFATAIVVSFILLAEDKQISFSSGMIGLWPCSGGNKQNQQIASSKDIKINSQNIVNITKPHCIYESLNGEAFTGYIAVDNDECGYFTDINGYITKIDINTCELSWRSSIGELLGYSNDTLVGAYQSLTLFKDKHNQNGILFAAPNRRQSSMNYDTDQGCYAIAIHMNNGSLWWKVTLSPDNDIHGKNCHVHGFMIDGKYAFGGLAHTGRYTIESKPIGRFFKIDIDQHELVSIWYPFSIEYTEHDKYNKSFVGVGIWNFPAIIDKYVIFGTGQLYGVPKYIDHCLSGDFTQLPFNQSYSYDVCGSNKSNNRFWRCLPKNMYPVSLVILNKDTFEMEKGIPLQGMDVYYTGNCYDNPNFDPLCPSLGNQGPDADLAAVAAYKYNNKYYVAASQKPGQFFVFEVPSGKLILSKKFGSFTTTGNFNMAVDEESMIGIVTVHGRIVPNMNSYKILGSTIRVCDNTGSVHGIDLKTGKTLWIIINPYGTINDTKCYNLSNYNYIDRAVNESCEYGDFVENENDNISVIIPPKFNETDLLNSNQRAMFRAPITILKSNMIFIPSETGDLWIHDLLNGSFLHHISCPKKFIEGEGWNRPGIKGGVSIVTDKIIFYCGSRAAGIPGRYVEGNTFVSYKLSDHQH